MHVEFRECNWADLWVWFEFAEPPVEGEKQYLEQVVDAWYSLGMLGGFNATALTVQDAGLDISYMAYDVDASGQLPSLMHNMSEMEYEGTWARCWFDLGTTDAIALDVLLNALQRLSLEYVALKRVIVGGSGETWPAPSQDSTHGAQLH